MVQLDATAWLWVALEKPWVSIQLLIWPTLVIGYSNAAIIARMTRSAMLEVLSEDYVRPAWAMRVLIVALRMMKAMSEQDRAEQSKNAKRSRFALFG